MPPTPPELESNLLQTISCSLSDIQVKLSAIQEQNLERDATLKQLEKDIQDMKGNKGILDNDDNVNLKSKRSKKSPCGLSVSIST